MPLLESINTLLNRIVSNEKTDLETRVAFINELMHLCKMKKSSKALELTKLHYSKDLNADSCDLANMGSYLCKSLVEYSDIETIVEHARALDETNKSLAYLKKLLYYSLLKQDESLSFQLIDELRRNGVPIKVGFFYPLIVKAKKGVVFSFLFLFKRILKILF